MISHLPERLDLLATADAGRELQGALPLAKMPRLLPVLSSSAGDLQVQIELGKDPDGTRYIAGVIQGNVELVCQRCLEPMRLALDLEFRLGIVRDLQGMGVLHTRYEPLLAGAEPMLLADIITDEVLLALPLVPAHEDSASCSKFVQDYKPPVAEQRQGPFAVLADLKQKP